MRQLRFRITIRRLALLIVLVALGLVGWRVYREGPEAHWVVLKLRYGNVQTRRATAHTIVSGMGVRWLREMLGEDDAPKDPREHRDYLARRQERGDMLFSALLAGANDPDPECRATALSAAGALAVFRPSDLRKSQVLEQALVALRDREATVRAAGLNQLVGIAQPSTAIEKLKAALWDPSVEVQEAAAFELGMLGVIEGETQTEVASILAEVLASQRDDRVRIWAARGMSFFGIDRRRHPGTGPDVVPALLGALRDSEVKVRRVAASILSGTTVDARSQLISGWNQRSASIIPACRKAMTDTDEEVRDHASLALFWLGMRDPDIIARLEEEGRSRDRIIVRQFQDAVAVWRAESEPTVPGDPALGEKD